MKLSGLSLIQRMKRKAAKASVSYAIVAVGIDNNDCFIDITTPRPRYYKKGGGYHAEEILHK